MAYIWLPFCHKLPTAAPYLCRSVRRLCVVSRLSQRHLLAASLTVSAAAAGALTSQLSWQQWWPSMTSFLLRLPWRRAHCSERSRTAPVSAQSHESVSLSHFSWLCLWQFLRPYLFFLCGAVLSAVFVAICNVKIPQLLGELVNCLPCLLPPQAAAAAGTSLSGNQLLPAAKQLILSYLCQAGCTVVYIMCLARVGEGMASDMRCQLFQALLAQEVAFYDATSTGQLVSRLSGDVQDFKSAFKLCIAQGLRSTAQIAGCVCALYSISPTLTYITCCAITSMVCVGVLFGSILRTLSRQAQHQSARATAVAAEALTNIRTVRACAMEPAESAEFGRQVTRSRDLHVLLGAGIGVFQAGTNLFVNGAVLATLWAGASLMQSGQLAPGHLMAFLVAAQTIQRSLAQLSVIFGSYVRGVSAGARVFEFMSRQPKIPVCGGCVIPSQQLQGAVEFRNVTFSYPTRSNVVVLDDLQLTLEPGQVTALVGLSGCGKTTCAALLERFYDVDGGCVLVDGRDVRQLDPQWLRGELIGYIHQEPALFSTSIRENIRYGRLNATDKEVEEAARLADAHHFITSLPHAYDTPVGERGLALSGGQRQRVAIARAVLKNPAILILDEATSALDAESERNVQLALDRVAAGRTVLVIAHRLSTVRAAHRIAVLAAGRVVELGTHDELMKKRGAYWDLVKYNSV